jgi:hypothetical protein
MAKETDLLRDPVTMASQRYREQIEAFKVQYVPKPSRKDFNAISQLYGVRPEVLLRAGRSNGNS